MKKIVTLSVLLFIICAFYWACKKDQTAAANKNLPTEEQQLIANAKTYFENNVRGTNVGKQLSDVTDTIPGQFDPVKSLIKNANWDDAYTIKLPIGKIVVAPIQFKDSLYLRLGDNDSSSHLPINNLSKLIVYTDSAKQVHAEVVTGFPDSNFIKNPSGPFTGIALVQDWQGNFLRGYSYENGQIRTLVQRDTLKPQTISTDAVVAPNSEEQEILCTERSYDVYVDGVYAYSHDETICVDIGSGGDNDGGGGIGNNGYGNIAGGGGGGGGTPSNNSFNSFPNPMLCQNFNFTNVGNSFTGTILNLAWQYGNNVSSYTASYPNSCLTIPNYNISQAQASAIFNNAFNSATNQILIELTEGITKPIVAKARLVTLVNSYLNISQPGSLWNASGSCSGRVLTTTISVSSYCGN